MLHPTAHTARTGRLAQALMSIQHPGGRVSVRYRTGDIEVVMTEVDGGAALVEPVLWGQSSWHLVLDGQAIFEVGGSRWELLPEASLSLDSATPCTIVNPSPSRLRVLSVVSNPGGPGQEGRP